jgi:hypothetical protein
MPAASSDDALPIGALLAGGRTEPRIGALRLEPMAASLTASIGKLSPVACQCGVDGPAARRAT